METVVSQLKEGLNSHSLQGCWLHFLLVKVTLGVFHRQGNECIGSRDLCSMLVPYHRATQSILLKAFNSSIFLVTISTRLLITCKDNWRDRVWSIWRPSTFFFFPMLIFKLLKINMVKNKPHHLDCPPPAPPPPTNPCRHIKSLILPWKSTAFQYCRVFQLSDIDSLWDSGVIPTSEMLRFSRSIGFYWSHPQQLEAFYINNLTPSINEGFIYIHAKSLFVSSKLVIASVKVKKRTWRPTKPRIGKINFQCANGTLISVPTC